MSRLAAYVAVYTLGAGLLAPLAADAASTPASAGKSASTVPTAASAGKSASTVPTPASTGKSASTVPTPASAVESASAVPTPASAAKSASTAAPDPSVCEDHAAETAGMRQVLDLDLPTQANWLDTTPPYSYDDTASVAAGYDRVGYCLQLDGKWVWTSAESGPLGLPTQRGQVVRERVDHLRVLSNVDGVSAPRAGPGWLEMWPNAYAPERSHQVAGEQGENYDTDDTPEAGYGYGSFQVHAGDAAPHTALAVNAFTATDRPLDLGIGTASAGEADWTFATNARAFSTRRLTVYARPSVVDLTVAPQSHQLYPRNLDTNDAEVRIAGEITNPRFDRVQLWVDGKIVASAGSEFALVRRIPAGLAGHDFELRAIGDGVTRRVGKWVDVVAGDAFVVQGQSNAVAQQLHEDSAAMSESPWIRSFGNPYPDVMLSGADRSWHRGIGDTGQQPGAIGQWAVRMARDIVDSYGVPVAIVNGAHGGQPIGFFQRNDSAPGDLSTNYGRLLARLDAAGLTGSLRGILWYQGESDNDNAAAHVDGFTALHSDWRSDFGDLPRVYVHQVRTSPCNNTDNVALREAQRQLGPKLGVTLLSTNGLDGHDGCHFSYVGGYRELGDRDFAVVARDLYGGPAKGVAPPNPASAEFACTDGDCIAITMKRPNDELTVDTGVEEDFDIVESVASVTSVRWEDGKLILELDGPAHGGYAVTYRGHLGAGPWIRNASGVGMLAFDELDLYSP